MNEREYYTLRAVEEHHWWYHALHRRVLSALLKDTGHSDRRRLLLDAGCGTGGMLRQISRRQNLRVKAFGIDWSGLALGLCGPEPRRARSDVCGLPFKSSVFDYVLSLDVLCHGEVVSDLRALQEIKRVLKPGGLLILNLPAHPWLRSSHDVAVKTERRYTRADLAAKIAAAGLRLERLEYWNAFIFVPAMAIRFWRKRHGEGLSDLGPVFRPLNALMRGLLSAEHQVSRALPLPVGLSLLARARRARGQ